MVKLDEFKCKRCGGIMNIEKKSLYTMIDCVVLKSLNHILKFTDTNELYELIVHLLLDDTIIIKCNNIENLEKYVFSLLGMSPDFKETYLYDNKKVIENNSIIGIDNQFYLDSLNDFKYVFYDIDTKKFFRSNLSSLSNKIIADFILDMIEKAKKMDEIAATDYIRNNLRKIKKAGSSLRNYIMTKKMMTFKEAKDVLDIDSNELPVILEFISSNDTFIKKDNEMIYYST